MTDLSDRDPRLRPILTGSHESCSVVRGIAFVHPELYPIASAHESGRRRRCGLGHLITSVNESLKPRCPAGFFYERHESSGGGFLLVFAHGGPASATWRAVCSSLARLRPSILGRVFQGRLVARAWSAPDRRHARPRPAHRETSFSSLCACERDREDFIGCSSPASRGRRCADAMLRLTLSARLRRVEPLRRAVRRPRALRQERDCKRSMIAVLQVAADGPPAPPCRGAPSARTRRGFGISLHPVTSRQPARHAASRVHPSAQTRSRSATKPSD